MTLFHGRFFPTILTFPPRSGRVTIEVWMERRNNAVENMVAAKGGRQCNARILVTFLDTFTESLEVCLCAE
jgi:putative cell wall-binding protein